jgi:hypothetical protein
MRVRKKAGPKQPYGVLNFQRLIGLGLKIKERKMNLATVPYS